MLVQRQRELADSVAPVKGQDAVLVLAHRVLSLFFAYPSVRMDDDKAEGVARTYAGQLEHLPLWAVEAGIAECQKRNNPFPPSAGELRAACESKVEPFRVELAGLRKILEADVYESCGEKSEASIGRVREVADSFKGRMTDAALKRERNAKLPSKFDEPRYRSDAEPSLSKEALGTFSR